MKKLGLIFAIIGMFTAACMPAPPSPTPTPPKVTKKNKPSSTTTAPAEDTTPPADVIVTVPASTEDGYEITLRFIQRNGTIPTSQKNVFSDAAERWSEIITSDLDARNLSFSEDQANDIPAFSGTVDDLLIDVVVAPIDGPYNVLGSAGPRTIRSSNSLPVYGRMVFDSADIDVYEDNGGLEGLILHEMGHVIGIGTLWDHFDHLSGAGTADPRHIGTEAVEQWSEIGVGNIPVANTGGAGTRDSHWREADFGPELMTGYIDSGLMPISSVTVGSLDDLGYEVDYSEADAFNPYLMALRAGPAEPAHEISEDILYPVNEI